MKKAKLKEKTEAVKSETKYALETILDNLNQGQRKKIEKVPEVKVLLERYGITK